jgi:hypothetical protein
VLVNVGAKEQKPQLTWRHSWRLRQ